MSLNYISIIGYGWTGSSVVVDLLREYDDYEGPDFEFSMIWEPNGILDLENALVDNWDFLRHDTAIRDFITYCEIQNRKGGKFSSFGIDISNKLDVDFIFETNSYIDKLIDFKYQGNTRLLYYKLSAFKLLIKKVLRKLFNGNISSQEMYMAKPSKDKFLTETRIFIDKLFQKYANKNNIQNVILDQAIPASNILKTMNYFNQIKSIVIDRDPRDVYVNLIKRKVLIGAECSMEDSEHCVKKFVKWHKILRAQDSIENNDKKILRLKFENVILDYENSINKIHTFLDIKTKHSKKKKYFNPELSEKKIGLWKSYKHQEEIDYIYQELKEYCYET